MDTSIPGRYHAFGIALQSALPLPEVREAAGDTPADVTIRFGDAPRPASLDGSDAPCISPHGVWFQIDGIARFLVRGGDEIVIERIGDAGDGAIRAFLLGTAIGAVLLQRGMLPLHASAVVIGERAVAFTGASGAGKSTIALHLNRAGHALICDDICAVDLSGPSPMVWPGLRNLKLWRASLEAAGRETVALEQVLPTIDKYRLPIDGLAPYCAYPLAAVVQLDRGDAPSLTPLTGAAATAVLISNTFRGQFVGGLERRQAHFAQCLAVARASGVMRLVRPWSLGELDGASRLVETMFGAADA